MRRFRTLLILLLPLAVLLAPSLARAQSSNGAITGTVADESGAVVAGADLVLKNVAAGVELKRKSGSDGSYAFRNLLPGTYELSASHAGFRPFVQRRIEVALNSDVRVDVPLSVGAQTEEVEVVAAASTLKFDTGAQEGGIAPDTLQQLPLLVAGTVRSSAGFAVLMPGISTGGQNNAFDARINGGMALGDEAVVDGVGMQQGHMSQSGMVSIFQDFPYSPDMVSEVKVLTSSYEPQYGSTTSGQIIATTKSGTNEFHGSIFNYHRNDALNATQFGTDEKPENRQNNFGANVGGPAKIPGLWSDKVKSYFYVNVEGFRLRGGVNRQTISIPSLRQRNGDFSDWRDADGNLIPIYDPATTRVLPDGTVVRDPFPGNIIPANRINPIALEILRRLPNPTSDGSLNNFLANPIPDTILADSNYLMVRFDTYLGQKDHVSVSLWHQRAPAKFNSQLPRELASETYSDPQDSWINRLNWDHTFGPNVLHHFSFGYLNRNEGYGCISREGVDELPRIAGVPNNTRYPPRFDFSDGFAQIGCDAGVNEGNVTTRPTFIANNMLTWVAGSHTIKGGLEFRTIMGNIHNNGQESGIFRFGRGATSQLGVNSGSPIASFLLGAVDNANAVFRDTDTSYPRQRAYVVHLGDTWKATDKLTLNYGLRWDVFTPSREKYNRFSFFDPIGTNPAAGGRPGRLAFAGTEWGEASFGRDHPEETWSGGFAPRLGATYALNAKTVIRGGYGIFYDRAYYPGWNGGITQDGFVANVTFASRLGGLEPAFILNEGFPQNFQRPPFIRSDFLNGQTPTYRPFDANERPRAHQWNLTIDREIGRDFSVSIAYVGSKGERLPSNNEPINVLDPSLLSLGSRLYDEFQPGQTVLHGVREPYAGWREQMTACAPSLAQALLPFPQYCGALQGLNENKGESWYNSAQFKAEKRFSGGTYALVSYTLAKLMTSAVDNIQREAVTWSGASGVISPFEKGRNKALATDDVTHVFSAALVYELPFGKGRRFLDQGGISDVILGGWTASTVFRYSSGMPFFFRSSFCNVPSQFRAGCIPALKSGANPFAQDKGSFDPAKGPLFNKDAFESVDSFNFYYGRGERVTDIRGFGYRNQDLTLIKNTRISGRVNLQLRFEVFNIWNWHIFAGRGEFGSGSGQAFNTDLASPEFGRWTGRVSDPRNIQVAARLEF